MVKYAIAIAQPTLPGEHVRLVQLDAQADFLAHFGGQSLMDELAYLRSKGLAVDSGAHGCTPF